MSHSIEEILRYTSSFGNYFYDKETVLLFTLMINLVVVGLVCHFGIRREIIKHFSNLCKWYSIYLPIETYTKMELQLT